MKRLLLSLFFVGSIFTQLPYDRFNEIKKSFFKEFRTLEKKNEQEFIQELTKFVYELFPIFTEIITLGIQVKLEHLKDIQSLPRDQKFALLNVAFVELFDQLEPLFKQT